MVDGSNVIKMLMSDNIDDINVAIELVNNHNDIKNFVKNNYFELKKRWAVSTHKGYIYYVYAWKEFGLINNDPTIPANYYLHIGRL